MTQQPVTKFPQFYLTAPSTCPYLEGKLERKVFTQLLGPAATTLNDALTHAGFRRSQSIAYKPACDGCSACISVRIVCPQFNYGKSFRRIANRNEDLVIEPAVARATEEQFELLQLYLKTRHPDGGMTEMDEHDYAAMVEDTSVMTRIIEYRLPSDGSRRKGPLVAASLTDVLDDGLSMVYSFFDPQYEKRGLGTFMILDHIDLAISKGLDHVYLGYWVQNSPKMAYKARFRPLQALTANGWRPL